MGSPGGEPPDPPALPLWKFIYRLFPRQVKRCKTDTFEGLEFGNEERPECTNLLTIYQLATGQSKVGRAAGVVR